MMGSRSDIAKGGNGPFRERDRIAELYAIQFTLPIYDPTAHYKQVKDDWRELRTPDGR
jgi:hypothetical protein